MTIKEGELTATTEAADALRLGWGRATSLLEDHCGADCTTESACPGGTYARSAAGFRPAPRGSGPRPSFQKSGSEPDLLLRTRKLGSDPDFEITWAPAFAG